MQIPIYYRNNIPFFYDKSKSDFQLDLYERFDPMVVRQSMIHGCDHLWKGYPMQPVENYLKDNWPSQKLMRILEIGCGVGRLIGSVAEQYPNSTCWGIDYSYQMLKRVKEIWLDGSDVYLDISRYGIQETVSIQGKSLTNLNIGLAKCEALPFENESLDLIFSSFLLDRLNDPLIGLKEMKRVLKKEGRIMLVSPLNFNAKSAWDTCYPVSNLLKEIRAMGFTIMNNTQDITVYEPMDIHGNKIIWNCIGLVIC